MKLTSGAVECLSRGAAHDDPDVNAVGPNGDLFEAGQMVTEHRLVCLRSRLDGIGAESWFVSREARTCMRPRALLWQSQIRNKTRMQHVPDVLLCVLPISHFVAAPHSVNLCQLAVPCVVVRPVAPCCRPATTD